MGGQRGNRSVISLNRCKSVNVFAIFPGHPFLRLTQRQHRATWDKSQTGNLVGFARMPTIEPAAQPIDDVNLEQAMLADVVMPKAEFKQNQNKLANNYMFELVAAPQSRWFLAVWFSHKSLICKQYFRRSEGHKISNSPKNKAANRRPDERDATWVTPSPSRLFSTHRQTRPSERPERPSWTRRPHRKGHQRRRPRGRERQSQDRR